MMILDSGLLFGHPVHLGHFRGGILSEYQLKEVNRNRRNYGQQSTEININIFKSGKIHTLRKCTTHDND